MLTKRIRGECGYSLVEVMASIVILTIAIIPMVGMFDMGLTTATRSSNYDKARAFANGQLEQAKNLGYGEVRDNFPVASSTPTTPTSTPPGTGSFTSSAPVPAGASLPSGSTYTVTKQYMARPCVGGASCSEFQPSDSDQGLIRVTVAVQWETNTFTTVGLVA